MPGPWLPAPSYPSSPGSAMGTMGVHTTKPTPTCVVVLGLTSYAPNDACWVAHITAWPVSWAMMVLWTGE